MSSSERENEHPWKGFVTVYGKAAAQGSKRIGRAGGANGKPILLDADPRLKFWRAQMQDEMRATAPAELLPGIGYSASLIVFVQRPGAHFRANGTLKENAPVMPVSGLDLDKVQRACGDAGTGLWWRDDRQVVKWTAERLYSPDGRECVKFWACEVSRPFGKRKVVGDKDL